MRRPYNLSCPVQVGPDPADRCGGDIKVWAYQGHPGSFHEPPSGGEIEDVQSECDHQDILLSGSVDESIWQQIENEEERRYEDAQEARVDEERDRWYPE